MADKLLKQLLKKKAEAKKADHLRSAFSIISEKSLRYFAVFPIQLTV